VRVRVRARARVRVRAGVRVGVGVRVRVGIGVGVRVRVSTPRWMRAHHLAIVPLVHGPLAYSVVPLGLPAHLVLDSVGVVEDVEVVVEARARARVGVGLDLVLANDLVPHADGRRRDRVAPHLEHPVLGDARSGLG